MNGLAELLKYEIYLFILFLEEEIKWFWSLNSLHGEIGSINYYESLNV